MNWDSIEQLIRILMYAIGSYVLGDGVASGEMFQSMIGGAVNVAAFVWWIVWEKGHEHKDMN